MSTPFKTRGGLIAAVLVIVCLLAAALAALLVPTPTATTLGEHPSFIDAHPKLLVVGVMVSVAVLLGVLGLLWERKAAKDREAQGGAIDDVMTALGLAVAQQPRPTSPTSSAPAAGGSGNVMQEVDTKWKDGVAIEADAYAKPWYILCGETGTGKSNLLARGELPMARSRKTGQELSMPRWESGTLGLDWWFFEQSVVLDTAGNLLTDHGPRWLNFLKKVKTVRPAEPINGMIVAISAESLQVTPPDLQDRLRHIAGQMTAARQILGVRFPVYVLITKADMIGGFSEFFPVAGDPRVAHQIMGWSNPENPLVEETTFRSNNIRDHLKQLVDRLKQRRTLQLTQPAATDTESDRRVDQLDQLFAFPENLLALSDNLKVYLDAIIPPNQSADDFPPFFRGVYLTSSIRKGQALDRDLAAAFGLSSVPKTVSVASERSFFIKDLLTNKIIAESGLVTPLQAVRTTFKHRRLAMFAASATAAVLVLAATALGITQLAGKIKPHRDYWRNVASQLTGGRAQLALYDANGSYRGAAAPEVLNVQTDNVKLIKNDTTSWLLPMSRGLDNKRKQAHAAVYFNEAVFPAIDSAATRLPSENPADWTDARVKAMNDLATLVAENKPATVAKFAERANGMIRGATPSSDERTAADELFAADAGWPTEPMRLDESQRQRLAARLQKVFNSWASSQVNERAWTERVELMQQLNLVAKDEKRLLSAISADASLASWRRFQNQFDSSLLRPKSTRGWGEFEQTVADGVAVPPRVTQELDLLAEKFASGKDSASVDARAAIESAREIVGRAAEKRRVIVSKLLEVRPDLEETQLRSAAKTYEKRYVGADWASPSLARRVDAYQAMAAAAESVATLPAVRECKYIGIEAALAKADDVAVKAQPQGLVGQNADQLDRDADGACRRGADSLRRELRSAAWASALADGIIFWADPKAAMQPAAEPAVVENVGPLTELAIDTAYMHDNVESWLVSWNKIRRASSADSVSEASLVPVDQAVEAYKSRAIEHWNAQITAWLMPEKLTWTKIAALGNQLQKPMDITAAVRRGQQQRDQVFTLLGRSAGALPELSEAKTSLFTNTASALRLIAGQRDSAAARIYLVTLPAESLPDFKELVDQVKIDNAELTAVTNQQSDLAATYWSQLSTAVLRGVIDANRANLEEARKAIRLLGRDTFPFTRGGIRSATADQLDKMDRLARLLRPDDAAARRLPPALRQVLSPGVVGKSDWDDYLSAVVRITAAVRKGGTFDLQIKKAVDANGFEVGKWNAIIVKYVTPNGPAQFGPQPYILNTPLGLEKVVLNEKLDIQLYSAMDGVDVVGKPLFNIAPAPTVPFWLYRLVDAGDLKWKADDKVYEGDLKLQSLDPAIKDASLSITLVPKDKENVPLPAVPVLPK